MRSVGTRTNCFNAFPFPGDIDVDFAVDHCEYPLALCFQSLNAWNSGHLFGALDLWELPEIWESSHNRGIPTRA